MIDKSAHVLSSSVLPLILLCAAASALCQPRPVVPMEGNQLKLSEPVLFETGSDKLRPESDAALRQVADFLQQKPYVTLLRIESHTDSEGDRAKGQSLSERRAMAAARWLVANGVTCARLIPVGFGAQKPIADNGTPEGRAQNRRTLFYVAALRGRPVGGQPVDGGGRVAGDPCR